MFVALYSTLLDLIDTGFANKLSLDNIVAFGSYMAINQIVRTIMNIGKYAYNNTNKKPKTCVFLGFSVSVILGAFLVIFKDYIPLLYGISDTQREIMSDLMKALGIILPSIAIGQTLSTYLMINDKQKLIVISDIVFYIVCYGLDIWVVIYKMPVDYLVYTTGISYVFYDIVILLKTDVLKDKLDLKFLKPAFLCGFDIVIANFVSKAANTIYSVYASYLPEKLYSIHCIVNGVVSVKYPLNNLYLYMVQKKSKELLKDCMIKCIICTYIISLIALVGYCGKVGYLSCVGWLCLYQTEVFTGIFLYSYNGIMSNIHDTKTLRQSSYIDIIAKILLSILVYYTGLGLVGFGLIGLITFAIRSLFIKRRLNNGKRDTILP
jgi:hypothetical protein